MPTHRQPVLHFLGLILIITSLAVARITPNVPSGMPHYELIDRLEAYGCAISTFRAFRPQAQAEIWGSVNLGGDFACGAPEWLMFERDVLMHVTLPSQVSVSLLNNLDDTIPLLGIHSHVAPLFPLREGRLTVNGTNLNAELFAYTAVGNEWGLAFFANPGWFGGIVDNIHFNGRFYFQEGYIKAGYGRAEFTYGRVAQRFGEAKHGSLLMSGAAHPIDLMKFAIRPRRLSAPFSFLGPFTFETWMGWGGGGSGIADTRLLGVGLGLRPKSWLEISFLEVFQFSGVGAPALGFADYLSMIFLGGDSTQRQRMLALNLGIWGPSQFVKLYGQIGIEEDFSEPSFLAGIWFPKLGGEGMDLRAEYVHIGAGAYQSAVWTQGLTYVDSPLGHPLGPNARGIYVDLGYPIKFWRPSLSFFHEKRNTENRIGGGAELTRRWGKLEISGSGKFAMVENQAYQSGVDATIFAGQLVLKYAL